MDHVSLVQSLTASSVPAWPNAQFVIVAIQSISFMSVQHVQYLAVSVVVQAITAIVTFAIQLVAISSSQLPINALLFVEMV